MPENNERDETLVVRGYVVGIRIVRSELREWIQEEVIQCKIKVDILEPALTGVMKSKIKQTQQRLDEINVRELKEAVDNIDTKCKEIEDGAWNDVLDARPYLQEGVAGLESLARELLRIRDFVDSQLT